MSDNHDGHHDEGHAAHQAPWVPIVTVGAVLAFAALILSLRFM